MQWSPVANLLTGETHDNIFSSFLQKEKSGGIVVHFFHKADFFFNFKELSFALRVLSLPSMTASHCGPLGGRVKRVCPQRRCVCWGQGVGGGGEW